MRGTVISLAGCVIARDKEAWRTSHGTFAAEQRRCLMPTFMCFLNWTDQGAKAVKDGAARYEAAKTLVAGLGGRMVGAYVTTGQYDVVFIVEMPNGDAMTK